MIRLCMLLLALLLAGCSGGGSDSSNTFNNNTSASNPNFPFSDSSGKIVVTSLNAVDNGLRDTITTSVGSTVFVGVSLTVGIANATDVPQNVTLTFTAQDSAGAAVYTGTTTINQLNPGTATPTLNLGTVMTQAQWNSITSWKLTKVEI